MLMTKTVTLLTQPEEKLPDKCRHGKLSTNLSKRPIAKTNFR